LVNKPRHTAILLLIIGAIIITAPRSDAQPAVKKTPPAADKKTPPAANKKPAAAQPGKPNFWVGNITITVTHSTKPGIQLYSQTIYHVRLQEETRQQTVIAGKIYYSTDMRLINAGTKVEGFWEEWEDGQHGLGSNGSWKSTGSGHTSVLSPGSNFGSVGHIVMSPGGERLQYVFEMWPDTDSSHYPTTEQYYQGDPPKKLIMENKGTYMAARSRGDSVGFATLSKFSGTCNLMEGQYLIKDYNGNPEEKVSWRLELETCNNFDNRINNILQNEGDFVDDPNDKGGATNKGITMNTWKKNAKDLLNVEPTLDNLKNITDEQATTIYKARYWDEYGLDKLCDGDLKYMMFDFCVNSGPNAVKIIQKTLNQLGAKVTVNGQMNSQTIDAINAADNLKLYNTFKNNRLIYYKKIVENDPTQEKFLKGWTARTNGFKDKTPGTVKDANCQ
jgi:lysozyme family protein